MKVAISLFFASFSVLTMPSVLEGKLGEPRGSAEKRAPEWRARYGGVVPIFSTDSEGRVVQECWSAPPEGWTEATALKFAKELLPANERHPQPKKLKVDGPDTIFAAGEKYRIYLTSFRDIVIDLEVVTVSFRGYRC